MRRRWRGLLNRWLGSGHEGEPSLGTLAERRGFCIGAAVNESALRNDAVYREVLAREFNMVTCENAMKFGPLRPSRDGFAFEAADGIVAFAESHGMSVRGHTLVWHDMLPGWFAGGRFGRSEMAGIVREHINVVVRRYAGRVTAWDVVNEAVEADGTWRQTPFLECLGRDYLGLAFQWAHEADPGAKLFYNDFCADTLNAKSDAIYASVRDLVRGGVPIHGVGLQMHVRLSDRPEPGSLAANIRRFVELGLEVHVTEMDVALATPASRRSLAGAARVYGDVVTTCLTEPGCGTVVTWGVTDRYSWIPERFPGFGAPLLFDAEGRPKPAYFAVRDALRAGGAA